MAFVTLVVEHWLERETARSTRTPLQRVLSTCQNQACQSPVRVNYWVFLAY